MKRFKCTIISYIMERKINRIILMMKKLESSLKDMDYYFETTYKNNVSSVMYANDIALRKAARKLRHYKGKCINNMRKVSLYEK
jgi:hypothetical protein